LQRIAVAGPNSKKGKMKKSNIALHMSKLRPVQVLALMNNVVAKMTGNANFAEPAVKLTDMQAKADELKLAIEAATDGSKQSRLLRDELLMASKVLLNKQADYVRSICEGDAAKLQSSGYPMAKERQKIGIPGMARKMEARMTGLRGQLDIRWHSVHGAHGYQIWMTDQDPAVKASWQAIGYTTRVSHTVTDLESYKAYWFCVSAIGAAGEGAQSDPALGRAA
jgi:hypothetical protein